MPSGLEPEIGVARRGNGRDPQARHLFLRVAIVEVTDLFGSHAKLPEKRGTIDSRILQRSHEREYHGRKSRLQARLLHALLARAISRFARSVFEILFANDVTCGPGIT